VFSIFVLGVFSCFLSAFDSALISAVQLALVGARGRSPVDDELDRFRVLTGLAFLATVFFYLAALSIANPAFVATVLMGAYAIAGALVLATAGGQRLPPRGTVLTVCASGLALWMANLLPHPEYLTVARTQDINLVPLGVALFLAVTVIVALISKSPEGTHEDHP
jgi:hypothetical protein